MIFQKKQCNGFICKKTEECQLYAAKPENPFFTISPLATLEECPYFIPIEETDVTNLAGALA